MAVPLVRLIRSGLEESAHDGDVAVADQEGRLVAFAGNHDRPVFARSSMKPLQATVSLSLAAIDFPDREVAVMCASHNAERVHIEAVRSVLSRAGVPENDLRCQSMLPWDQETMMAHPLRLRINSDCSGKHAGMLAACRSQVWPRGSYREADHPLQQRVLRTVLSTTGLPEVRIGVDGCGVPVHGMPLRSMAHLYASLTSPERFGSMEWHARRVVEAMVAEPYVVAGRNRVDTAVMEVAPGVLVKAGAEGLICAALPEHGLGLAVKIADGAHRGAGPALIHALRTLHALTERQVQSLAPFARPSVLGGGRPVGELVAGFDLRRAK